MANEYYISAGIPPTDYSYGASTNAYYISAGLMPSDAPISKTFSSTDALDTSLADELHRTEVGYFGNLVGDSDDSTDLYELCWEPNAGGDWGTGFTCPGTGTVDVVELSAYCRLDTGASGNIRLGIYNASTNRVTQGTSEVSLSGTSYSWQGHMSKAACGDATLTGGTSYKLAAFYNPISGTTYMQYESDHDGYASYEVTTDYSAGLPNPLPSPTGDYNPWVLRCGVQILKDEGATTPKTFSGTDALNTDIADSAARLKTLSASTTDDLNA